MKHNPSLKTPVDDKTLRAIGKVVVNFAQLEVLLGYAISGFLNEKSAGSIMQAQFGLKQNLAFLETLFYEKIKDEYQRKKFNDFIEIIQKHEESRNRIIHSHW